MPVSATLRIKNFSIFYNKGAGSKISRFRPNLGSSTADGELRRFGPINLFILKNFRNSHTKFVLTHTVKNMLMVSVANRAQIYI